MQKWHSCHAISRNKFGFVHYQLHDSAAVSSRHFLRSALRTQHYSSQDLPSPLPRKSRIRGTTQEVQGLVPEPSPSVGIHKHPESGPPITGLGPNFRTLNLALSQPGTVGVRTSRDDNRDDRPSYRTRSQSKGVRIRFTEPRTQPTKSNAVNLKINTPRPGFQFPRKSGGIPPRGPRKDGSRQNASGGRSRERKKGSGPRRTFEKDTETSDPEWNTEELDYLEAKLQSDHQPVTAFLPTPISQDLLTGMGPALAVDQRSMTETIHQSLSQIQKTRDLALERVEKLARMQIGGLKPICRNKQELEALQKRVEQILAGDNHNNNAPSPTNPPQPQLEPHLQDPATDPNPDPIPEEIKSALVHRLLGGEYTMRHPTEGDVASDVERQAHRNTTYLPKDGHSLVRKFKTLMSRPGVGVGAGKAKVKMQQAVV